MTDRSRSEPRTRVQVSFDEGTLDRIDALIPILSAEWMKGKRAKRADVLRLKTTPDSPPTVLSWICSNSSMSIAVASRPARRLALWRWNTSTPRRGWLSSSR